MADYTDYPQSGNIQGYWPLDEASGNAIDAGPNGNDLVETSGTIATVSEFLTARACRDFEAGDTEYFKGLKASMTGLDFAGSFSIGVWLKAESTTDEGTVCARYQATNGYRSYKIRMRNDGTYDIRVSSDGTATDVSAATNVDFDNHIASWVYMLSTFTVTTGATEQYFNGHPTGVDTLTEKTVYDSLSDFIIGAQNDADEFYDGRMAELVIWDTCLIASEVKQAMEVWRPA